MDKREKQSAGPPPGSDPLEFVMSDGSVDRMGDIIEPDGWMLDNFRRNPVALFKHDAGFLVGNWHDVGVRRGQLTGRLELVEPSSDRQREVITAVKAGMLRAVSVGFHAKQYEPLESGGLRFTEAELVECSLVTVPANPNALAIAKSLGISPEGQRLIFGVSAEGDHPSATGLIGVSAGKEPTHRKQIPMSYSERIEHAQQEVVGLRDQLATLPDADDVAKVGELSARIEEITGNIATWQRAEKALGATSEPITVPMSRTTVYAPKEPLPSTAPKAWARPKPKDPEPGYLALREFVVKTLSFVEKKPPEIVLQERYGSYGDFEAVKAMHEWTVRAATAPATSGTAGWAAEFATIMYADFVDSLLPGSIYAPLSARGFRATLGRYAQISMPTRVATPTVAGSFVAEGAPIPVRQAAFTPITLGLKKMAVITSYTREIAEHSTPQIEAILRQLIQEDTQVAVDTVLIDATAISGIRPAGLRNGVSATTATAGGGFAALVGDIKNLVGVLAAANSLRAPVWIMNPVQAIAIALTQNAGGDFPFQAEINGNRLMGYPVIVSSTCTAGMIILVDAADFMTITGDTPRFDVSDQATLHFEDTTPLQISTGAQGSGVLATPVRSMFQTDSLALRMVLPMNWAMRRTGVIAWTQSVTW